MQIEHRREVLRNASRKLRSIIHAVRAERFYVLSGPPNAVEPRVPCEIRVVTSLTTRYADHLTRVKGFCANWWHRIELGHRCYMTYCEGSPVGFGWVSLGSWLVGAEQPLGQLAPDVGFIYDEITLPEFRGKRLAPSRLAHIASDLAKLGYRRTCQLIADDNPASQRSAQLAGFKRTDSVIRMHRVALGFRVPEGGPPPELRASNHPHNFAAATAHFVLGTG